ncbi:glyoxalase/bleomycin resistance/extradiol dioxygenase family protein [Variovorax sp. E3]|uniref:VOC family protein n=1 Tax=Variovorax sp. E3 TaxID=1914993 RepID=UPI0018DC4889|nr:VOC family protein [Variovorax sp. E3]
MQFSSVRLVTNAFESLVSFYTRLSSTEATRLADGFAEVRLDGATLAISEEHLVQRFNAGAATAAANRSAILEFEVADVPEVYARLRDSAPVVMPPTLMPWGNHSLLLRDPDGNLVNIFSRPAVTA